MRARYPPSIMSWTPPLPDGRAFGSPQERRPATPSRPRYSATAFPPQSGHDKRDPRPMPPLSGKDPTGGADGRGDPPRPSAASSSLPGQPAPAPITFELGGGPSGSPPGPAANVSHGTDGCCPTPGRR